MITKQSLNTPNLIQTNLFIKIKIKYTDVER